ncbi:MAG TPA: VOC family protein [Thermoanaerobaculia bacterium]|jgi:PhnB protein|nr:VOC family protein [Thermoanaerobaculia bacterium]
MPQLTPYLSFDGTCTEAMRFYERVLGGTLEALVRNGDTPAKDHLPHGNDDRIMHAKLVAGDLVLMAGDALAGQPYEPMKGFNLAVTYPTADEARGVYDALAEGGRVTMPFDRTFWAEGAGMLTDRYGTPWIVNGNMQMQ